MADTEPLLSTENTLTIEDAHENKHHTFGSSFAEFIRVVRGKKKEEDIYAGLDDDEDKPISVLGLFRYSDLTDRILMMVALIATIAHTVCAILDLILFGRLMGLFAIKSFGTVCSGNSTIAIPVNASLPSMMINHGLNMSSVLRLNHTVSFLSVPPPQLAPAVFRHMAISFIVWLLIIGSVEFVFSLIATICWIVSIKRQGYRISVRLFRSLLQRNIEYMDEESVGEFNVHLFESVLLLEEGIGFEFLILIGTIFTIVGCLITSFVINWQLTLIMLCIMPFVIIASFLFSKVTARETMNELLTYANAGHIVQEVFSSIRTVFSLNGSEFERNRYEKELHPTRWCNIRKGVAFGIFKGWLTLLSYIVYAVGFIFGTYLKSEKDHHYLTISNILVIVSMFEECFEFFSFVGPFYQALSEAQGAAAPVFRLIEEENDPEINEFDVWGDDIESSHSISGDIEFRNVRFRYPTREDEPALRNLSFVARSGQTTALVGASGSGKSTCIQLLLRYYELTSGSIKINDKPIDEYNLKKLRQNLGVVSQEPVLFAASIYENIRFGKLNATQTEIEQAAREANAHDFIMKLPDKYQTLVGEHGIQLSGGERQRIALARALVRQPTFLLLDEATSALDTASERVVQATLDRACKGRTTIVIAHRLSTIKNVDQICVLEKGRVVERGTHDELMAKENGKYRDMVEHQHMQGLDDIENEMTVEQAELEVDAVTTERARLISESQLETKKEKEQPESQQFAFFRLLALNKPEWFTLLIGCLASMFSGATEPLFSFLFARIIHAFKYCTIAERRYHVVIASIVFLCLGLAAMFVHFVQCAAFAVAGARLTQRVRSKAFACLLRQEVCYFDKSENSSGAISTRLSTDAAAIQEMTGTRLGVIFEAISLAVFGMIFGFAISWQISLVVLGPAILLCVLTYTAIRVQLWLDDQIDNYVYEASSLAVEVIENMRTVKYLAIENEIIRQYSEYMHNVFLSHWGAFIVCEIIHSIYWVLDVFTLAAVYYVALILIEQNKIQSTKIIMVIALAMFATQALEIIAMLSDRISNSVSAAEDFFNLFDRVPSIDNGATSGKELDELRGDIQFDHVKFIYPSRPTTVVLDKLQMNVKSSKRVALIGSSGCGKSTIVQLLERFYDVTDGRLLIDGVDIRQLNVRWLRSHIGLVGQEPVLFDMTIRENITYGLKDATMEDIIDAAKRANIHDFISILPDGYDTKIGTKGNFLSGGEKQRVAIARALIRRPKILLFDEATSALDSQNEQAVQEAIENAQAEDPMRTSLIIAHRLSTIRTCDLICVLDKGKIVESGTHDELVQLRGAYYRMLRQNNLSQA